MIIQPTLEQTRRVNRTYGGPGFGPRSFECLGMGIGLGLNSGSGVQPSTPLTILGASATKLWLRADLGVSGMGTAGATWVDQSGNWGANFIQATVANQPALATDGTIGQSAFTSDGVNDTWDSTGVVPVPGTNPFAVIIVAKIPSLGAGGLPLFGADSFATAIATQSSTVLGTQNGSLGPHVTAFTTWKRIIAEFTNSTSDRFVQGSLTNTGANAGSARNANTHIFGIASSSAWLAASVAELILVTPIPGSYTAIDAYLTGRYGSFLTT